MLPDPWTKRSITHAAGTSPKAGHGAHSPSSSGAGPASPSRLCRRILRGMQPDLSAEDCAFPDSEFAQGHHPLAAVIAGGRRLMAVLLAVVALSPAALAQTTCFGGPAVMTCLDSANGSVQVSCFGNSKFRTCTTSQGPSFTQSNTGGNNTNPSSSAALQQSGQQSGATMVQDPAPPLQPTMVPNSSTSLQKTVPRPTANPCVPGKC
jgi:hypothetical protein